MSQTNDVVGKNKITLTTKIFIALGLGVIVGLSMNFMGSFWQTDFSWIKTVLNIGGSIFINLMKMLVVPVVFISLVCGICVLEDVKKIGKIGLKSFILFIITTLVAVAIALFVSKIFNIGIYMHLPIVADFKPEPVPSLAQMIIDFVPSNPLKGMVEGNVLQVMVFAILFGFALNMSGAAGKSVISFFQDLNKVVMQFIVMLMETAPYGVFCLITLLFAKLGFQIFLGLLNYFLTVIFVLLLHLIFTYVLMLRSIGLSPWIFFKKLYSVIIFAFTVSSSSATIPLAIDTAKRRLGISNATASFVIPLGININKNGTAIMQAVATIFIANAYHVDIGWAGFCMVFFMTLLVSIGTAAAPSIGVITLVIILRQLGLPVEGMALIIAVDRLLDMTRTPVNVIGNILVACMIDKSEKRFNYDIFKNKEV